MDGVQLLLEGRARLHDLRGASRFGPNGLKINKETSHDILSWRRFMKMA